MHWSKIVLLALSSGSLAARWNDPKHGTHIAVDKPDNSTAPTKKWIIEFAKVG